MGQAQINVRTRACSRTSIARTKQTALTHSVRGKRLKKNWLRTFHNTVVPAMGGHPWDQAKVSVHDRWPLIRGTGWVGLHQTHYNSIMQPTRDIYIVNTCTDVLCMV